MAFRLALLLLAAAAAACTTPPAITEPPPPFPLREFFRNPDRGFYRLSDDGRWLSFLMPARGDVGELPRMNLFVQPLEGSRPAGEPRQLTREGARDIFSYRTRRTSAVTRTPASSRWTPPAGASPT
jgi:hypothetical protein